MGEGTGVTCPPIHFPKPPQFSRRRAHACTTCTTSSQCPLPPPPPHQNYDHAEMADLSFSRPLGIYGSTVNSGIPQWVYRRKILRPPLQLRKWSRSSHHDEAAGNETDQRAPLVIRCARAAGQAGGWIARLHPLHGFYDTCALCMWKMWKPSCVVELRLTLCS